MSTLSVEMVNCIEQLCKEHGGEVQAIVDAVKLGRCDVEPIVVNGEVAGVIHYTAVSGKIVPHFAVQRRFFGKTLDSTKTALQRIASKNGIDTFESFIPETNRLCISYVRRLGWKHLYTSYIPTFGTCLTFRGEV